MVSVRAQTMRFGELHRMLPPADDLSLAAVLGDVDGDGDLDALIGNLEQDRLYLNDSSGVFADATARLPAVLDNTWDVALGDVDGDGDLDAWIGNNGPDRLHLNDGSGVFTDATSQIPLVFDYTFDVALGDVDGDGDLDALTGNGGSLPGQLDGLYLNDGSGVFTDATVQLSTVPALTRAVGLGDVDGDGDLDALFGNIGQDGLFLNDGSGVFTDATSQLPAIVDNTFALALGDVDGDGDVDALTGNFGFQVRLYLNGGSGVFTDAPAQIPLIFDATAALALGDVDADGDLDSFLGNGGGTLAQAERLWLNNGAGVFANASLPFPAIPDRTFAVALGDLDGDGDLDALAGNVGQDRLYLNDGSGAFAHATASLSPTPHLTPEIALGDVEGDGDLDALIGGDPASLLFINDGSGLFTQAASSPPLSGGTCLALGDVDGDADLDVMIGRVVGNRLYVNNGSGAFADATAQLPALFDWTYAVALGDVDGDGDLDALVGNGGNFPASQDRLYLNNGAGVFSNAASPLPAIVDETLALALGDVDGDGDLDALFGNGGSYPGQQNRLYLNDGSGVFADATAQLPAVLDDTRAVALGDVDGDGDLDVLVGNFGQDRLHLNGGSGAFTDATAQLPASFDSTQAVALGDVDGDGDLDALIGTDYGQQERLYSNDGSGLFSDATAQLPAVLDSTEALALGDVDGDGDLDALIGYDETEPSLLSNLSRQLAWRGIPRVGKPLTLDLFGPSLGAWFLGVSLGTASVPIPPLGTLRLDPASFSFVSAALLDAQGRASITFPVPANASLIGASVYWQAVVVGPARLTNLEVATLTNL